MMVLVVGLYRRIIKMRKLNLKSKLIILLIIISIASSVYVIFSSKNKVDTSKQQFITPPKIENYFGNNLKITHSLKKENFDNFPKNISYLKQSSLNSFTQVEMDKISKNFGFTISPLEFNDIKNGKIYIWNGDKYSLIIYSKIRKIEVTPAVNPKSMIDNAINKQLSDEDYKNIAINLLSEKLNINKDSLKFSNFAYLKTEDGLENFRKTTKEDAEITQVNLYSSSGTLPIFTTNPQNSQIYVQFTKDGEILNLEASLYSEYKLGEIEYKIKDYKEVIETINDSVLVSLNDSNVNLPDLKSEDIKNITIGKVSLVYLQESLTSEIIQPVFLLEGMASVKGFDKEITASLYLSAYSKK
ncbi:MAG: hypothetical protein UR17_C0001G0291 [Candidatus Woesebacteria bacterium GW2011_GWF1_31_35]|uniref:Uncharacterized protein n=1 Tax=Candidatus Woesebacteria bacterium GW2011_GWC2_31_9 TaxID=1618586 RepID=A0A0F9YKH3_9BACT|nr:MAG: hypothetical protein UR17_C0001G0291 [Candidatus Woesebacteria bacterium GW2011_GWF1_31_35]KKP23215.1 MAG: hypothetical protein UR11_C0001G0189 [Candidatus Woesebacteria bacterium GW2011_GWC1_30_29]KKP25534.1 MAG: hypothetical protein UR13_C0008G0050 [Candidatus Woesebacteria bacterium GW2011_GWD1_31_12]KKP27477.1 MAG: hypothetical protein UR16_C0003G0137 [Candidatus Woesebacteria bacterium GW2011_GWB1_31_29]KKP32004.1 MAG: hypothetical protein UR21_C0003G0037 [Candidatus Woesebacteria 